MPFPYLQKSHVEILLDSAPATGVTWPTTNTLQFPQPPQAGTVVSVVRKTPHTTALVKFLDGVILTEDELNLACLQLLYIVQETLDDASVALSFDPTKTAYDAEAHRITNLGDPEGDTDALTLRYYKNTLFPEVKDYVQTELQKLRDYVDDEIRNTFDIQMARIEELLRSAEAALATMDEHYANALQALETAREESAQAVFYYRNTRTFQHTGPWRDGGGYEPYNMVEYLGSTWMLRDGDDDGLTPPPGGNWQIVARAGRDYFVDDLDGGEPDTEFFTSLDGGDISEED